MSFRFRMHAAAAAIIFLSMVLPSRSAWADAVSVFLAGPTGAISVANEVVNRVRGELIADGFHVEVALSVPEVERLETLRRSGRGAGAPIVVGVFVDETTGGIDLWLLDTISDRAVTRRLDAPTKSPDQGPQVVARHAVSLLRASLLDFVVEGLRSAFTTSPKPLPLSAESPRQASSSTSQESLASQTVQRHGEVERPQPRGLAVEGGLGVLGSFEGIGPSVMPVVRVRMEATPTFQLRLTGAGLGSTPTVQAPTGSATVAQDLAQFDAIALTNRVRWVRPMAGVGVGVYYAGVKGSGILPYEGRNDSAVALALAGTVGATFPMARDVELSLEVQALLTEPGVVLRFADVSAARMGRPLVLTTLTVAGWL